MALLVGDTAAPTYTRGGVAIRVLLWSGLGFLTSGSLLVAGIYGVPLTAILVVAGLVWPPRYLAIASVALGTAVAWFLAAVVFTVQCMDTADFCGNTSPIPLLSASLVAFAIFVAFALITARRRIARLPR